MTFGDHVQSTFWIFFWKLFIPTRLPSRLQFWEATKGLVSTHWNCAKGFQWVFQAGEPLLLVDDDVFGPVLSTVRKLGDLTIRCRFLGENFDP